MEILVFFQRIQAANLADDWDNGIAILNAAVGRVLSAATASTEFAWDERARAASAGSGGGTATIDARVRFEGSAAGLSARVVWPFDQAIEHAATTVPGSGGHRFVQQEPFQFRDGVLWHRGTHSSASGRYNERLDAFEITVAASIESFNVHDMVTADSITRDFTWCFGEPTHRARNSLALRHLGRRSRTCGLLAMRSIWRTGQICLCTWIRWISYGRPMRGMRIFRRLFQHQVFPDRNIPREIISYFPWSRYDGSADRLPEEQ